MRVMGHNAIAIVLASIAFYLIGMVWYGFAFSDLWMAQTGYTEADFEGSSPLWMALGGVICLLTVIGLSVVLRWGGEMPALNGALKRTFLLWAGFGLTAALYGIAYTPMHSVPLLLVDAGHLLVGWLAAAAILALMK